jgi:hypothetical protein
MSTQQAETSKGSTVADGTIQYRAVSGLAVLALALGVLSAAAMVGPVLWSIPILAVIVALVAMRRIRASEDLAGWNIAFLGLLLAILFGIAAPARTMSRHHFLASRAEAVCDQFFTFLKENNPHAAHQLRERAGMRKTLTDKLPDSYAKDAASQASLDKFVAEEPMKTLLEVGDKVKIERLSIEPAGHDERTDIFNIRYEITPTGRSSMVAVVAARRTLDLATGVETWQIDGVAKEP